MEDAVARVRNVMGRLAPPCNNDARAKGELAATGIDWRGRREMHERGYRAEHPLGAVDQIYEIPEIRSTDDVSDALQRRKPSWPAAHLDEVDASADGIDDLLIVLSPPAFRGHIRFATGHDDPVSLRKFGELGRRIRIDVTFEGANLSLHAERFGDRLEIGFQKVYRFLAGSAPRWTEITQKCLTRSRNGFSSALNRVDVWVSNPKIRLIRRNGDREIWDRAF
ncbi:MAG TPA: hypothetical protein VH088_23905 [Terriglobales bacterium]|nr:hypothetical protein [Terriglobales bacterium]